MSDLKQLIGVLKSNKFYRDLSTKEEWQLLRWEELLLALKKMR